MRLINTKVHGVLDYVTGFLLIGSPWLFNFVTGDAEMWIPVIVGVLILLQSTCTRYETGIFKMIPMRTHIVIDFILAILLTVSPWLFGFYELVRLPHLLIGVMIILVAVMSARYPGYRVV